MGEFILTKDNISLELENQGYFKMASSPAINTAHKALGAGKEGLTRMQTNLAKVNHAQNIELQASGNKRRVIATSSKSTVILELDDINKLAGSNKGAKKMLDFILIKVNKQAYRGDEMVRDYIDFPLKELITAGLYSTPQSARKGYKDAMDIITSMKFSGEFRKGTQNKISQMAIEVLFPSAYLKNGICTVYMNSRVNWDFVLSFYTIIPKWAFKLKNNAYTLVRYIFYLARQNTEAIKEKGYFTISIRAVCAELNLPDMEETKNPGRDIINVIEDAISEIEQENNDSDFTITPVNFDVDTPARERLTNGYLKIGLKGKYHFFIDIAKAEEQQIAAYKRRQERIKEQAAIKALAEKSKDDTPETKE